MKLLVTGASGLLGSHFVHSASGRGFHVDTPTRAHVDITDAAAVMREVATSAPDVVVHCAAYTAVDNAESDEAVAMAVNRDGTVNVAMAATAARSKLVVVSTDYVFDGSKTSPYRPDDTVGPLSVYGRSKLEGERAALEAAGAPAGGAVQSLAAPDSKRALVVRTGWLYGSGRRTFVDMVMERIDSGEDMRVVDDQRGSPTWARDMAEATLDLILHGASGVWHVASNGEGSWLELAKRVSVLAGVDRSGMADARSGPSTKLSGVTSEEWGAPAKRPAYSVLDVTETERALGRTMPEWQSSLEAFMTPVNRRDQAAGHRR